MAFIEKCNETNNLVVRPIYVTVIMMIVAVIGALMSVSAAWGRMNTLIQAVDSKVDKTVFDVTITETKSQLNRIDYRQQRLEDKVDKILDVVSKREPYNYLPEAKQ